MSHLEVAEGVERRAASWFADRLVLGLAGFNDDTIAAFVTSVGGTCCGLPIVCLLIPYAPESLLLTDADGTRMAAETFYLLEVATVKLVAASEPVLLDGLYRPLHCADYGDPSPPVQINRSPIPDLANNKLTTKKIAHAAGLETPAHRVIEEDDFAAILRIVGEFAGEHGDFVVKGDTSWGGNEVKLFPAAAVRRGARYAAKLGKTGQVVFLEQRIYPRMWRLAGQRLDWNIRSLLTVCEQPVLVDDFVRCGALGHHPVNIIQGAWAREVSDAARETGVPEEEVREQSLRFAAALHDALVAAGGPEMGYMGIDLIAAEDGIYFLEANVGSVWGWISKLTREHAVCAMPDKMFESFGPFLARHHAAQSGVRERGPGELHSVPHSPWEWIELHRLLLEIGWHEASIAACEQALEQDGDFCEAWNGLGLVHGDRERYGEAAAAFARAVAINPIYIHGHYNLGQAHFAAGRFLQAADAFGAAAELDPRHRDTTAALGRSLHLAGDSDAALDALRRAVRLDPQDDNVRIWLGFVLGEAGRTEDAAAAFREAVRLAPHNGEAHYYLGETLLSLDRRSAAAAAFEQALRLDPELEPAYDGLKLARLGG